MVKYLSILLLSSVALAQMKVVVIDTGLDLQDKRFSSLLCDGGLTSKDFTNTSIEDVNNHGTHVAGIIKQYAGASDYCLIILKFFHKHSIEGAMEKAIEYAISQKADIINISGGGDYISLTEQALIKNAPTVLFIVAAGNDAMDLNCEDRAFYPACYDFLNIISVGCSDCLTTNFGPHVKVMEHGINIKSTLPKTCNVNKQCSYEGYMSGTSQATAIVTGKTIYKRSHQ